jgi:hypothetical protein
VELFNDRSDNVTEIFFDYDARWIAAPPTPR